MAIVVDMSQRRFSRTSGRPFRTLLLVALGAGAVLAGRAAVADKGGSYDPADSVR